MSNFGWSLITILFLGLSSHSASRYWVVLDEFHVVNGEFQAKNQPPELLIQTCRLKKESFDELVKKSGLHANLITAAMVKYGSHLYLLNETEMDCLVKEGTSTISNEEQHKRRTQLLLQKISRNTGDKVSHRSGQEIDLNSVAQKVDTTQFLLFDKGLVLDRWASRSYAVGFEKKRLVMFNSASWNLVALAEWREILILHEIFGVMGIDDSNYQISSALWWATHNKNRAMQVINNLPASGSMQATSEGGSIVGTGGGGAELLFKLSLLITIDKILAAPHLMAHLQRSELAPKVDGLVDKVAVKNQLEQIVLRTKVFENFGPNFFYFANSQDSRVANMYGGAKKGDSIAVLPKSWVYQWTHVCKDLSFANNNPEQFLKFCPFYKPIVRLSTAIVVQNWPR